VQVSLISEQVEMGVAIRMAILDALARGLARDGTEARGLA
jgi:aspartate carbamoyltransferase catalytic subunit